MRLAICFALLPAIGFAEVPQGKPNANFLPAFENQTRVPALPTTQLEVTEFVTGLENPWGIARMPDGRFLVTERPGRMRLIGADGGLSGEIGGLEEVDNRRQGGLMDIALSPNFDEDQVVFWTYAKMISGGTVTAAARGVFSEGGEIFDARDIFVQQPPSDNPAHFGSRIIPLEDGTVWITTGEHSAREDAIKAQDINTTYGKVVRLTWDGLVPMDNPYVGRDGDDAVWSYGHRNIQGAAIDAVGDLWTIEHGPRGGDELNKPEAGRNYGWPVISYGINYDGSAVGGGKAVQEGMEQPVYYYVPSIATSALSFYQGVQFPEWNGNAFIGALRAFHLNRLSFAPDGQVAEHRLLADLNLRVRDVKQGPDDNLYLLSEQGSLIRLAPAE